MVLHCPSRVFFDTESPVFSILGETGAVGHPYDIDFEKHAVAVIMKCPNKDACGWTAYSTQAPLPMPHAWTSDPAGHKLIGTDGKLNSTDGDGERAHACAAGYKGLLCAECDGNYTGAYWDEARLPHSLDLARCCPASLGLRKATLAAGSMRTHGTFSLHTSVSQSTGLSGILKCSLLRNRRFVRTTIVEPHVLGWLKLLLGT